MPHVTQPRHERDCAPQRPRAVHARHRRELVGDLVDRASLERPERRVLVERIDEPEVAGQQARRHERPEREADEGERGRDRDGVAPQRVVVAELAVHEDEDRGRHHEVQRPVEVVAGDDERLEVQRPLLEGVLVVDAERLLPADELERDAALRWCRSRWRCGSPSRRSRRRRRRRSRPTSRGCTVTSETAAGQAPEVAQFLVRVQVHEGLRPYAAVVAVRRVTLVTERERGCAGQADDERHRVPEQADSHGLAGLHAERVEQQREHAFTNSEAADRDREDLGHRDRGHEGEHAPFGIVRPIVCTAQYTADTTLSWYAMAAPSAANASRGSRRRPSTPTWTAPM